MQIAMRFCHSTHVGYLHAEKAGAEISIDGEIELRNVTFAYPTRPRRLVFKQFNLHIPAGEMSAALAHGLAPITGLTYIYSDFV